MSPKRVPKPPKPPSPGVVQEKYQQAARALKRIVTDPAASPIERRSALNAFEKLLRRYVDRQLTDIGDRSNEFQQFVVDLERVIQRIRTPGVAGLASLRKTVESSKKLLVAGRSN